MFLHINIPGAKFRIIITSIIEAQPYSEGKIYDAPTASKYTVIMDKGKFPIRLWLL